MSLLLLTYIIMVALNVLATVKFQNTTDGYSYSYVQPDGVTFSVWGLIYGWLFILVLRPKQVYTDAARHLQYAFILNGMWLLTNGLAVQKDNHISYWLPVSIIFTYLVQLISAYRLAGINYCTQETSILVHGAISANLAWVFLASFLNLSNNLFDAKTDFSKYENLTRIGGPDWAIGVFGLAGLVSIYVALENCDFIYPLITSHALFGIVRNQANKDSGFPHKISQTLHDFAQIGGIVLIIVALVTLARVVFYQFFLNQQHQVQTTSNTGATTTTTAAGVIGGGDEDEQKGYRQI
jgi:hypothetical protein